MRHLIASLIGVFIVFSSCQSSGRKTEGYDGESLYESYAPDGVPWVVAEQPWVADMHGNHRVVVEVEGEKTKTVLAELMWRRPDLRPETKKILVEDATTGATIKNVLVEELTAEKGSIVFETTPSKKYYIYYLPYKYRKGWNDARYGEPWNDYLVPEYDAEQTWLAKLPADKTKLPKASIKRFESRSKFDAFTPMGTIATKEETSKLRDKHSENPVLFVEDRAFPIRLKDQLPVRWIETGASSDFKGAALRNEYYVWQVGVWAAHNDLQNVKLTFSDFKNGDDIIKHEEFTCFNQEGTNWDGNPITFNVDVSKDKVQALWCGVQIPDNAKPGKYRGTVTLTANNTSAQDIAVEINVKNMTLADKGDGELWRHARLRWLNSTIGEDNLPVEPYDAMTVEGNKIGATGKLLKINNNGLPQAITIKSYEVLAAPMNFVVETKKGQVIFNGDNLKISKEADGLVKWESASVQEGIKFNCLAYMEYDGYIRYNLKVSSSTDIAINDIKLVTEYSSYASEYFMGVGFKGGYRPITHAWDWKGPWDSYWMGNAKAGLHVEYRGGTYHGPLINDYKPDPSPVWSNAGKGKIEVSGAKGLNARVVASTGSTVLSSEDKDFEFALLITPMKELNPSKHFSERYYHADSKGFDEAAKEGANIANIHHAQSLNPMINYPFVVQDSLIQFIQKEHKENRKVKIYYTIRELTNYVEEIYALRSLNNEIFADGVGYGLPWHCEHLIDNYRPAWYTELPNETSDAALVLSGFSRWINYYLEGLRWMYDNYDLDGIYMDDVSFDRTVMKRMRKISSKYKPTALVDLHSNTDYSIGPMNQYADFFPYVDRLWFGEHFKYDQMTTDEWFVTFSGIPFGQMSEMLQDGGNRFLGMVYGTTARHSYGEFSPAPVWKLWKEFGIQNAKMLGYWDDKCPVRTSQLNVKATAYVQKDQVLIALGNFDSSDKTINLNIDWKALGMKQSEYELTAPAVENFQEAKTFAFNEPIAVKSKGGMLLILSKR